MRSTLLLAFGFVSVVTSASAAECNRSAYASVGTAYPIQEAGYLATEKPVLQSGVTLSCGPWSYDLWTSYELSNRSPYGARGEGDEWDLTIGYADEIQTAAGPIAFELSGSYWALTSLGRMADDIVELYADVGRPFTIGGITIGPFFRVTEWVGLGAFPSSTFVRPGVRIEIPLSSRLTARGDVSRSFDLSDRLAVTHGEAALEYALTDTWSVSVSVQATEGIRTVGFLGISKSF